ncbi:hypothetical protein GCM10009647_080070 [Streptomyces sanglieri]
MSSAKLITKEAGFLEKMGKKDSTVALPIHVKKRELQGKIWLGLNLVEQGFDVVIGSKSAMKKSIDIIEPEVWFKPSSVPNSNHKNLTKNLNDSGVCVVLLDSEGGIFTSEETFCENRLSPDIIDNIDYYFAWGAKPASILENNRDFPKENIEIVGNPRFDLLHSSIKSIYDEEALKIRNRYDEFFLINTNFTAVNHFDNSSSIEDSDASNSMKSLFNNFIGMIDDMSVEFGDYNIVIRPHPAESPETYEQLFSGRQNLYVDNSGEVRPWISAAEVVIHNSCTTGIESAAMKTPVISYEPISQSRYDFNLPNFVSDSANRSEEVCKKVKSYLNGKEYNLNENQLSRLQKYIFNINSTKSADLICNSLESIDLNDEIKTDNFNPGLGRRMKRISVKMLGVSYTESLIEMLTSTDYTRTRHRFPSLSKSELKEYINNFLPYSRIDKGEINIETYDELEYVYRIST